MTDTNLRRLKRTEEGFTIEAKSSLIQDKILCDHCAMKPDCPVPGNIFSAASALGAVLSVKTCASYMLPLTFRRPLIGLNAPYWNTFRLGEAMSKRLSPGDRVALWETQSNQCVGTARVLNVEFGPGSDMLSAHAVDNHMLQAASGPDPAGALRDILLRFYGPQMVNGRPLSVVYLQTESYDEIEDDPGGAA